MGGSGLMIYFYFYETNRNERFFMPLKINVPYREKDFAKSKGAFWDAEQKTWFVPDHKDINDFLQWIDTRKVSILLKSPFFIAVNKRQCYNCSAFTTVIALASDNLYYLDYDDNGNEKWFRQDYFSFFSMPVFINDEVTAILNKLFPQYKMGYSKTAGEYWANHCEHCGALQGDFYLHCESGGAFFPIETEDCKHITLLPIPTQFDVELNTGISWASNADEILDYANTLGVEEFLRHSDNKTSLTAINQPKGKPSWICIIFTKIKAFFT
ncbi:DUF5710 domain-containing protein [Empedobacter brevis]|uniref:DUF5710 domain-containing protein n=1 Tax=Empedobacter brevis TaxID=247 RepID=UPI001F41195A|nr:DUF5710 domain-containing protein [Empedobacter brevis]